MLRPMIVSTTVTALLGVTAVVAPLHAAEPNRAAVQQGSSREADCDLPAGWSEVAARRTRYVVFGELHGTREGPEFIARLGCALARSGKRVLVAVEHRASGNAALQNAWRSEPESFSSALRKIDWNSQDGRGSQAMFNMITALHRVKSEGRAVDVVAFSGFIDEDQERKFRHLPGQGPHEAAQAENIRLAAQRGTYDHVIVLVGNTHARKTRVERGGPPFEPMAMQLGASQDVTSLDMLYGNGSAWNCLLAPNVKVEPDQPLPEGAIDCSMHESRSGLDLGPDQFMRLTTGSSVPSDPAYDGFIWIGPISGSAPLIPGS